MKKSTVCLLLLAALKTGSLQALNLTPNEIPSAVEGPQIKRYFFEDQGKRLTFRVDRTTYVSGTSDGVAFRFDDLQRAAMKISRSQTTAGIPFDEKNLASYRTTARALLPPTAANVQIEAETPNPISINHWTSHQFLFTFEQFGQQFRRSITFLNYSDKEQLIVDVSAVGEDYAKTYGRGYRVLNSITDTPISATDPT